MQLHPLFSTRGPPQEGQVVGTSYSGNALCSFESITLITFGIISAAF